jgi:hypothetical protein
LGKFDLGWIGVNWDWDWDWDWDWERPCVLFSDRALLLSSRQVAGGRQAKDLKSFGWFKNFSSKTIICIYEALNINKKTNYIV